MNNEFLLGPVFCFHFKDQGPALDYYSSLFPWVALHLVPRFAYPWLFKVQLLWSCICIIFRAFSTLVSPRLKGGVFRD